jgi:hypothetical protein
MGIGLAKIKEKGLYIDLNFRSMNKNLSGNKTWMNGNNLTPDDNGTGKM